MRTDNQENHENRESEQQDYERDQENREHEHEVTIKVNGKPVDVLGPRTTGLAIKEAAIAAGVQISIDFVLSIELGERKTRVIGDTEVITINNDSSFIAIAPDDNSFESVKPEVLKAIMEIKENFIESTVSTEPDGSGGVYTFVENVILGPPYIQESTWVGFHISFQYPFADVYPHYVRGDLARIDGKPLEIPITQFQDGYRNRHALQVSRRSNNLNPATDTATIKLQKVIKWMREQI